MQEPVDWKYQVYVKARKEYRNYKRYARLYRRQFNRARFRLSYVRRSGEADATEYYATRMIRNKELGAAYNGKNLDAALAAHVDAHTNIEDEE